jgi:hypothetical protein
MVLKVVQYAGVEMKANTMSAFGIAGILAAMTSLGAVQSAAAQGAGTTGANVLQMFAGGRATALSGAYVSASGDADVLFYNPAGIAGLGAAASLSYQQHVADIGVATGAGAVRLGRFTLGASAIFLDFGDIDEYVPDPDFGGQTGMPTGRTVSASEMAARLSGGLPLLDERLRLGASIGMITTSLAEASRAAPFVDIGAQYTFDALTIGAALRNLGGSLNGNGLADAKLPTEFRVGAMYEVARPTGLGAIASADLVAETASGTTGILAGIEAGLLPGGESRIGAVGRIGYNGATGEDGQGNLLLGGGLAMGRIAVDYAYQNYSLFGSLHRVGVRWVGRP